MKTFRYKTEYLEELRQFLLSTKNSVNLPSDVFFDIAKNFEGAEADSEKLGKLFSKAYTVLAVENELLVGVASMDKEGHIGIFAVAEGDDFVKACRLLIKALDRRAEKREIPLISVMPTERCAIDFASFGYSPFEGDGSPNEYLLVKEFEKKVELPPLAVKKITLATSKPISVEGKVSFVPYLILFLGIFFMTLVIGIYVGSKLNPAQQTKGSDFITAFFVVGLFFLFAVSFFAAYCVRARKLKKEIKTMHVTNALVVSCMEDSTWHLRPEHLPPSTDSYKERMPDRTTVNITYLYYDENMQLREATFEKRYMGRGSFFYKGQELIVACSGEKNYILCRYTVKSTEGGEDNLTEEVENTKCLKKLVPLYCVKMYYIYALRFLIMFIIGEGLFTLLACLTMKYSGKTVGWELLIILLLLICGFLSFGVPAIAVYSIIFYNKIKYKKIKDKPDTLVYTGKIVHGCGAYALKSQLKFYCVYKVGNEIVRFRIFRKFAAKLVKRGENTVKIAVNNSKRVVLVEKGKYPDVRSFFFPNY